MNKNTVTISARFADKSHYLNNSPHSVKFFYADSGKPLNETHAKKIKRITAYQLEHCLYPVFVIEDTITADSKDFEAEALLNLNNWSNAGLPRFAIKDIRTGKRFKGLPCCNTGIRPSSEPS